MKIVVIGGNGFVGSHLVDAFANLRDTEVIAFDRFSRPEVYDQKPNIMKFTGDFFSRDDVKKAIEGASHVVHCFTQTNPRVSDENPYLDIDLIRRSVEIFEDCAASGVGKVAYISSGGAVYGEPIDDKPLTEDSLPRPISPYGIGKLTIEQYLQYFTKKTGMKGVSYRLTNPYGPRQVFKNGQGVIPLFIDRMKAGEPLTLIGDGSSTRDYVYIKDAALMVAETILNDTPHVVYNLAAGQSTSLTEIVDTLSRVLDVKPSIEYKPAPSTFVEHNTVSMELFWNDFGKRRLTALEDGISQMV